MLELANEQELPRFGVLSLRHVPRNCVDTCWLSCVVEEQP
jgi:hypothetical protein